MPVSRCMGRARDEAGDARGVHARDSTASSPVNAHSAADGSAIKQSRSVSAMHVCMGAYPGVSVAWLRRTPSFAVSSSCAIWWRHVHPASANTQSSLHRAQKAPVPRTFKARRRTGRLCLSENYSVSLSGHLRSDRADNKWVSGVERPFGTGNSALMSKSVR